MTQIVGLNVGGNLSCVNGRGWVDPSTLDFRYLPIDEEEEQEEPLTFRDAGFKEVSYPHKAIHYDPEFRTFTYGHAWRGFGDRRLRKMKAGDILFFFSTLDLLPERRRWGTFIIGFFLTETVVEAQDMSPEHIRRLAGFENNAHLRYKIPRAHLLIKGSHGSRLYDKALPLSDPKDGTRVHSNLRGMLFTAGGRTVDSGPWYRWVLCSDDQRFAAMLLDHP